jgi:hypothetical protein
MQAHTDIHRESRVVHNLYGRGVVARVHWTERQAGVCFDDDGGKIARRVWLKDLTPEPVAMPPTVAEPQPKYRLVWPIGSTARADARQRIEEAMTGRGH